MTRNQLVEQIFNKQSYLCIGLDTDRSKLPDHLKEHPDGIYEFNKAIIEATRDLCVSYKINTAFYEAEGLEGWRAMMRTEALIPETHFRIADAKRGDIGNTSLQYAKAFFEKMNFDAITVAPYMGEDSVKPFLSYAGKWAIVLGLTSNPGARDFELKKIVEKEESLNEGMHTVVHHKEYLYEKVLETASQWGSPDNLMFVIGATQASEFGAIRKRAPQSFYLVPGVGTQGGSLKEISRQAMIADCGLLINVSRAIIFASPGKDFAERAREAALSYQQEMATYLP